MAERSSDEEFVEIAAFDTEKTEVSVCRSLPFLKISFMLCDQVYAIIYIMLQMDDILKDMNFTQDVRRKFREEKVWRVIKRERWADITQWAFLLGTVNTDPYSIRSITCKLNYTCMCIPFQIFASTLSLLTDKDLSELGVERMGDRALLRKRCRECQQSKFSMAIIISTGAHRVGGRVKRGGPTHLCKQSDV